MSQLAILLCLYLLPIRTDAGHGLMNSFGNIEWLPDAGINPDQIFYPIDAWAEKIESFFSTDSVGALAIYLKLSKEKLAEIVEMTKQDLVTEASVAEQQYLRYLSTISDENFYKDNVSSTNSELKLLNTLLEHRYILAIEYPDLPPITRKKVILKINNELETLYTKVESRIPQTQKDSLFFRKDEVAWIWEIAEESDLTQKSDDNERH